MKRSGKVFIDTLKKSRAALAAMILSFVGAAVVFYLYRLPLEPFFYAAALVCFFGIILFAAAYAKGIAKAKQREQMIRSALTRDALPSADSLAEEDCHQVIQMLKSELKKLQNKYETERQDEVDYYTAWVHQIKTPIAVMRMELGDSDTENARDLEAELFRIEQYVDMVLTYIRLGSGSSDLVIREYPLDDLIREAVRKFAPQFVSKRLRLCYDGTDMRIVTDKKWFSCIIEQIISNAIKYTPSGSITISAENDVLTIADTGIGIAAEDIPRIFEKGFTGENGRLEKRSSGLGLYLCRKAAELLQIPLSVESRVGEGSRFLIEVREKRVKS